MKLILSAALTLSYPLTTSAQTSCDASLELCDKAVGALKKELNLTGEAYGVCKEQLQAAIESREALRPSWYEKPSFLIPTALLTGLAAGLILSTRK